MTFVENLYKFQKSRDMFDLKIYLCVIIRDFDYQILIFKLIVKIVVDIKKLNTIKYNKC